MHERKPRFCIDVLPVVLLGFGMTSSMMVSSEGCLAWLFRITVALVSSGFSVACARKRFKDVRRLCRSLSGRFGGRCWLLIKLVRSKLTIDATIT